MKNYILRSKIDIPSLFQQNVHQKKYFRYFLEIVLIKARSGIFKKSLKWRVVVKACRYGFLNFGYLRSYNSGYEGGIEPNVFLGRFFIKTNILGEFQPNRWKCGFHHLMRRGSFYMKWSLRRKCLANTYKNK